MLLNYMEFSHQLYYFNNDFNDFLKNHSDYKYVGIMVHITRENLNSSNYDFLLENNIATPEFVNVLCMQDLIMSILYKICKTFLDIEIMHTLINNIDLNLFNDFVIKFIKEFDRKKNYENMSTKFNSSIEALNYLSNIFINERNCISEYVIDKFQLKEVEYLGNFSTYNLLHNFIKDFKKLLFLDNYSFYILFDNADELKNIMQYNLNCLIKERDHLDLCFKIAIKKGVFWNFSDIEQPHDYSSIIIDELYSARHTVYYEKMKSIILKRFIVSNIDIDVKSYFPESTYELERINIIKNELKLKYEDEYNEKFKDIENDDLIPLKSEYVSNRVNKFAQAALFRSLRRTSKSYSGFDNIVHLSSGIVRQFLDIAAKMYEAEKQRSRDNNINKISLTVQNEVIKNYADEFIDELENLYLQLVDSNIPDKIEKSLKYKLLYNLIESLGHYFKYRLMNPEYKEPRVFTFTLKDKGSNLEVDNILRLGVNLNYFQNYWYSSKSGVGKYPGYALNRRLCPRYVIDHTSFRGRIELDSSIIFYAMQNGEMPKHFFEDEYQKTLTEFEDFQIDELNSDKK